VSTSSRLEECRRSRSGLSDVSRAWGDCKVRGCFIISYVLESQPDTILFLPRFIACAVIPMLVRGDANLHTALLMRVASTGRPSVVPERVISIHEVRYTAPRERINAEGEVDFVL